MKRAHLVGQLAAVADDADVLVRVGPYLFDIEPLFQVPDIGTVAVVDLDPMGRAFVSEHMSELVSNHKRHRSTFDGLNGDGVDCPETEDRP